MAESANESKGQGRPIPFVYIDESSEGEKTDEQGDGLSGNFTVNEEAIEALRKISGPIAVVAIAGLYRTGKSYLVNRIVGQQSGFQVGPTVEACTRGIWMWSEPVEGTTMQGEKISVVVIDTEGLGGTKASDHYDSRIFSLAVLLCSKLVYNSMGSIDENAISNLSFVANLSQMIRVKTVQNEGEEEQDVEELASFFPSFLWVVRDFALDLVDEDGNEISEKDYLEDSLEQTEDAYDEATAERNHVRACLTAFFQNRECTTLVRPLEDETKLQRVDCEAFDTLRPAFQKGMEQMRTRLLTTLPKKTVRGRVLTGPMLATLAKTYVGAINDNGVPTISTAWEHMAENECREGLAEATEKYESGVDSYVAKSCPVGEAALFEMHNSLREDAMSMFESRSVGDTAAAAKETLKKSVAEHFLAAQKRNKTLSTTFCNDTLAALVDEHCDQRLGQGENMFANMDEVDKAFGTIRALYNEAARGPEASSVLATVLFNQYTRAVKFLQKQMSEENSHLRNEIDAKEKERQRLMVDLSHEKTVHAMDTKEASSSKNALTGKIATLEQELTSAKEKAQSAQKTATDALKLNEIELKNNEAGAQKEVQTLRAEVKRLKEEQNLYVAPPASAGCQCIVS